MIYFFYNIKIIDIVVINFKLLRIYYSYLIKQTSYSFYTKKKNKCN